MSVLLEAAGDAEQHWLDEKKSNFGLDIRDLCPQHLVYYSYSRRPHIMQFCEEKDWVQSRPHYPTGNLITT
jgi:hypothetical protein